MAMFIRKEVEHQERLEAAGYLSPTWRVLRALQSLLSATQLQGESAVAAPPFFPNAGRGTVRFRHKECDIMDEDALFRLQGAWENPEQKDECSVRMEDLEWDYWMGTEVGQLGGYGFQGAIFGVD